MRIIIADDELHVRRRLAEKIDWEKLGIDSFVLCSDGDEILESLKEQEAEVILTDIRMPRMDGIEAVRMARMQYPQIQIILMSAYDDKEYLKSALDLQVAGYLEKPFLLKQVTEVIEKTVNTVIAEKTAESARRHYQKQQMKVAAAGLCQYQNHYENQLEILKRVYPEFASMERWCAVLVKREEETLEDTSEYEAILCEKLLEEQKLCAVCAGMKRGCVVILFAVEIKKLQMILKRVQLILSQRTSAEWMIAAGSEVSKIEELYHSYQDAVVTMERHFYHQTPILYFEEKKTEPLNFSKEEENSFLFAIQSRNAAVCLSYLENLRKNVREHDTTLVRVTKNHYFQLALLLIQNREGQDGKQISEYYLWELFYQMNSLEEVHGFLIELLDECLQRKISDRKAEGEITAILEYINKNLQNPGLSLSDISKTYYMSVTYLCMYFKEKTGTTIRAYIIECRMKKAAELLRYTNLKVSEIAEAVGFTDQSYFTKSFGKFFGVAPSHYKEECDDTKK